MVPLFLHGGGDGPESRAATFGRLVGAVRPQPAAPLALVVAEADEAAARSSYADYAAIFAALGVDQAALIGILVGPQRPLTRDLLEGARPGGVFVCGGSTPLYHAAVCADPSWTAYLDAAAIPFGGTSAGAAVAAAAAILGGWRAERGGAARPILFQGASEGLDGLTVRPGLGLAPFAIDVHASQMGTLSRLIHAIDLDLAPEGWAIDEQTQLEVYADRLEVHGAGHAYRVRRGSAGGCLVEVYAAGSFLASGA